MNKQRNSFVIFFTVLQILLLSSIASFGQELKVAIAANLQPVIGSLKSDFFKKTGITISIIPGASGNLATQIRNGAPFDVFMSADTAFPDGLYKSGDALDKPVVYAEGVLIICSTKKTDFNKWPQLLLSDKTAKIAIGNPATAPYGKAAQQALKKENIYDKLSSKLVIGESISQVNTYISTEAVDVGFTTLSYAKEVAGKSPLTYITVDSRYYDPIEQGMVILKHGKDNPGAEKFFKYILSADAKAIFESYGYHIHN